MPLRLYDIVKRYDFVNGSTLLYKSIIYAGMNTTWDQGIDM